MTFPEKPTTHDLSDIKELKHFPSFNSSMAGTNTITDKDPNFAGQGTPSEASSDVVAKNVSYVGFSHNPPDLPGAETTASEVDVDTKSTGYTPSPLTWKELH